MSKREAVRDAAIKNAVADELLTKLLSTAYVTTGAVPTISTGFASIRLAGVITREDIERVFAKYLESVKQPDIDAAGKQTADCINEEELRKEPTIKANGMANEVNILTRENRRLITEVERLRGALKHYADKEYWICDDDSCDEVKCQHAQELYCSDDNRHGYEVAQAALEAKP